MRSPEAAGRRGDARMVARGCLIGLAVVVASRLVSPDNPIAAVFGVISAGTVATGLTLQFWQT